jgi:predicted signal transduction protein with EAL and GGDEF domain
MTEHVILTALRDWKTCENSGVSLKLSVNAPVSALTTLPLAQMLREQRPRDAGWPGLILEVTEDEIVRDLKVANDVANEMRSYGCSLAIDDFGAGYSSFAPAAVALQRTQDRPLLCHRLQHRPDQCRTVRDDRRDGAPLRIEDSGRRDRNQS